MLTSGRDTNGVALDFGAIDLDFVEVKGSGRVYMFMQGIGKLRSLLVRPSFLNL